MHTKCQRSSPFHLNNHWCLIPLKFATARAGILNKKRIRNQQRTQHNGGSEWARVKCYFTADQVFQVAYRTQHYIYTHTSRRKGISMRMQLEVSKNMIITNYIVLIFSHYLWFQTSLSLFLYDWGQYPREINCKLIENSSCTNQFQRLTFKFVEKFYFKKTWGLCALEKYQQCNY
jgi:hypothetical protein